MNVARRPFTISHRHLRITQALDPVELRIEGELDLAALPALAWALAVTTDDGDIGADIELTGLDFIDVGCLRALVDAAARLTGHHVLTLRHAPPRLRRLLVDTRWHPAPHLRLDAAARLGDGADQS
ncbi:STAS domain-containing protein [Nonomuraea recticatena]|uniref:MlaB-like STAS domain-containing protein n=1 Tax=Nonomuraea recticatena TaxID=46178 RepID=A0ABN3RA07_9ACTN